MGRVGLAQTSSVDWECSCSSSFICALGVAVASAFAFNCIWRSDFDILGSLYLLYTLGCPVLVLQQLVGVKEEEEGSCRNAFYKLLRFPGGSKGQECRGNV